MGSLRADALARPHFSHVWAPRQDILGEDHPQVVAAKARINELRAKKEMAYARQTGDEEMAKRAEALASQTDSPALRRRASRQAMWRPSRAWGGLRSEV